jgi:hypothetical protein
MLALTALSCHDKVKLPSSDSTPPKVSWNVRNTETGQTIDINGSASYAAHPGEMIHVTLKGTDPEGIQRLSQNGGYVVECRDPDSNNFGAYSALDQTLAPDADNMVLTSLVLLRDLDPNTSCPKNLQFVKNTITLNGQAKDYYGGITHESLKVVVML